MLRLSVLLHLALLSCCWCTAQKIDWKKIDRLKADSVLRKPGFQPVQALLLGSFHFAYPNQDAHKTDSSKKVDVLSPQRQKEIAQLTAVVKQMKPTRIYVESTNQQRIDSLYNAYLQGRHTLRRNEIDQVAFRLAKEMGLTHIYAVDAGSFLNDYEKKLSWADSIWNNDSSTDTLKDKQWNRAYSRLYNYGDSMETRNTILESFLVMADDHNLDRMNGNYLTVGFNTQRNTGADIVSLWWYNRNLRIFNNILNTQPGSGDRIVVLFGNGHMPILKHLFKSSPEFDVVELKTLALKYK